ncbi:transmembrane protein 145 isoform X2 [Lingula anatina]|uniref:Transmembrane protein 145 isoform X2 n=1 Tax=Lingula anatina TaxID=7574 RepID=A0A1S3I9M0_LINAN|nr:transmembrane protein 145 isoform X2 [Lingula anatina]|eukprot:XP_013394089.1 transmembrane protein 145 isoform X2 [Lingula anatina]
MEESEWRWFAKCWVVLTIIFISLPQRADSVIVEGNLTTREDWVFLTRFCFLSDDGELSFTFIVPEDYGVEEVLLYFDDPSQWASVYKVPGLTCSEKKVPIDDARNQKITLSTSYYWAGCKYDTTRRPGRPVYVCQGGRTFKSYRARWWFIGLANCSTTKGLQLEYRLHMTNSKNNTFFREFSADEFYILQVDISFFLCYLVLLWISAYAANMLRSRQLFHTTYKMYMVSLGCEVIFLLIKVSYYATLANTGYKYPGVKIFARIFESIATLTFLLMLILLAKGYTVTRGRLRQATAVKITVMMTFYILLYIVMFIWEAVFFDPGLVLYLYQSPPGYGLIGMRLLGWLWFCYATFFTLKNYPEKNLFYYPLFVFFTLWFWAGPIVILVAMNVINLWVREKVVNGVELCVSFVGHFIFLILTRPSAANKNFPFHVRTTQVGVMDTPEQNGVPASASTDLDSFGAHAYAPSTETKEANGSAPTTNFMNLFVTSKERSKEPVNIDSFPHSYSNGNTAYSS